MPEMKYWVVRFRYVAPDDYNLALARIPIEEMHIEAASADDAWERFVTSEYAMPREGYRKEEIYERPW